VSGHKSSESRGGDDPEFGTYENLKVVQLQGDQLDTSDSRAVRSRFHGSTKTRSRRLVVVNNYQILLHDGGKRSGVGAESIGVKIGHRASFHTISTSCGSIQTPTTEV